MFVIGIARVGRTREHSLACGHSVRYSCKHRRFAEYGRVEDFTGFHRIIKLGAVIDIDAVDYVLLIRVFVSLMLRHEGVV